MYQAGGVYRADHCISSDHCIHKQRPQTIATIVFIRSAIKGANMRVALSAHAPLYDPSRSARRSLYELATQACRSIHVSTTCLWRLFLCTGGLHCVLPYFIFLLRTANASAADRAGD